MKRYDEAVKRCTANGVSSVLTDFTAACQSSVPVFVCHLERLHFQVGSETDLFHTYYALEELKLRMTSASGLDWAKLRPQAEIELMGSTDHIRRLHYAALSLDGKGLTSYGNCIVQLDEGMVAHRTSCFEGNSAVIYSKIHHFNDVLRSCWSERHLICVAKHGVDLDNSSTPSSFPNIILRNGTSGLDDVFVELHVFGDMTSRTFKSVEVDRSKLTSQQKTLYRALAAKLKHRGGPSI